MAINKVVYGADTLIDLTSDTVTAGSMLNGVTAHDKAGASITGTIASRTASNVTVSGATVTIPSGHYSSQVSKSVASGSATTPATTISTTSTGSTLGPTTGLISWSYSTSQEVTPTVEAGYVSEGTAGTVSVSVSGSRQLPVLGTTTYNVSATNQTIASGSYLTGAQTIRGVTYSGLSAANIASGVTVKIGDSADDDRIASVTGTLSFVTYYTGTSAPASTLGSNGDIYLQTS